MFGLVDRSLIGKKLARVFELENSATYYRKRSFDLCGDSEEVPATKQGKPIICGNNMLFDLQTHQLKPVYGKAVFNK